jgi:hypothetical protein
MRKAPRSHFDISATETSKDKGVALPLDFETPKREMRKAPMSHFDISATRTSKDKGVTLPLHFETLKREMRKAPRIHFGYRYFKEQRVAFYVFSLGHPPWKKQLMNIEQVVETSAQLINGGRGKALEQSSCGILVCRSPYKSHVELRWHLTKEFRPGLTEEPAHANLDFNVSITFLLPRGRISLSIYTQFLYFCKDGW